MVLGGKGSKDHCLGTTGAGSTPVGGTAAAGAAAAWQPAGLSFNSLCALMW